MDAQHDPFLTEVRETFGRLVHSAKTHEQQAASKGRQAIALKVVNLVLVAALLTGALAAPLLASIEVAWATAGLALAVLLYLGITFSLDPAGEAVAQRQAAKLVGAQRDDYTRLIADIKAGVPTEELRVRRDALAERAATLATFVPEVSESAFVKARRALVGADETTFSADELDRLLPAGLREALPVPVAAAVAVAAPLAAIEAAPEEVVVEPTAIQDASDEPFVEGDVDAEESEYSQA